MAVMLVMAVDRRLERQGESSKLTCGGTGQKVGSGNGDGGASVGGSSVGAMPVNPTRGKTAG